jgi:hypothetical protein
MLDYLSVAQQRQTFPSQSGGNKLRDKRFAWCYDLPAFAVWRPSVSSLFAPRQTKSGEKPDHFVIAKKNEKTGC